MARTKDELSNIFSYHPPTSEQLPKYEEVRTIYKETAERLFDLMPEGPGRTVAIRKLHEAMMQTNSAIAFEGKF